MNQKQRLLNYLKEYGSINPLEALRDLGIYRLSAQIFKLRCEGYEIETQTSVVTNRFKEKCYVANYIFRG